MATIIASYNVTPNEATPEGRLWLSESDQVTRWSHTTTIYIYKAKHHPTFIQKLRDSLSNILVHYYPLAGRLTFIQGGRMELDCNAKGVTLLEAESTKTISEYGDFSPIHPVADLIPKVDYCQPIEELPVLLVQLTKFHGDQGLAIGVALSHPLCDGLAATRFINSWAKVTRGDTLAPHEVPFLDRTILKSPHPPSAPRFDHPELKPLPLVIGSSDSSMEQKKKTTATLLKLTSKQVEKLKKEANDQSKLGEGSKPYSRFEAIAAHIWRCASKARELAENQPTVARFSVDFRNRLDPPLPPNYVGNALAPTVTPTCYVGEIISRPLSYAAGKIREAVNVVTNEYIRSQLDFIRGQEQLSCMRPSFYEKGEQRREDHHFSGNPNLPFTSWMSMPVYDADFGWGKPMYFGPAVVIPYDRALIAVSPDGDGSITVIMNFQIAHMQQFKKFFYQHFATHAGENGVENYKDHALAS